MAFLLSVVFFAFALFFISLGNGFLCAFFVMVSVIAYLNSDGGPFNDDDQRPA